jgi:hypothetical protein
MYLLYENRMLEVQDFIFSYFYVTLFLLASHSEPIATPRISGRHPRRVPTSDHPDDEPATA